MLQCALHMHMQCYIRIIQQQYKASQLLFSSPLFILVLEETNTIQYDMAG